MDPPFLNLIKKANLQRPHFSFINKQEINKNQPPSTSSKTSHKNQHPVNSGNLAKPPHHETKIKRPKHRNKQAKNIRFNNINHTTNLKQLLGLEHGLAKTTQDKTQDPKGQVKPTSRKPIRTLGARQQPPIPTTSRLRLPVVSVTAVAADVTINQQG